MSGLGALVKEHEPLTKQVRLQLEARPPSLYLSFPIQMMNMSSRSTQTASQNVSVGLQTDLSSSRGVALNTKAWSPRPSSTTTSPLASARTRQISTSLDKVHGRIERPCCSPKYGSPKLQRRVSSGESKWDLGKVPQSGSVKIIIIITHF